MTNEERNLSALDLCDAALDERARKQRLRPELHENAMLHRLGSPYAVQLALRVAPNVSMGCVERWRRADVVCINTRGRHLCCVLRGACAECCFA